MDQQGFIARLKSFLDEFAGDMSLPAAGDVSAPPAESTPPAGAALPHSLDAPTPVSAPVAAVPDDASPELPSTPPEPTPPESLPPAGAALPHSLDAPAPVEPVVTADPLPDDISTATSESLIAPSSISHQRGDVVYLGEGAFGIVVSIRREGVMVSRLATPEGPIADV